MELYPYEIFTKIKHHRTGRVNYTVAYVPEKLKRELPLDEHPRLRIDGEVCGMRFNAALHPSRGKWYVLLPKRLLKNAGLKLGDDVLVMFRIADQNAVDVPQELERALMANRQASQEWENLTPGRRRGYAYRVASAKRVETREIRVAEVIEWLINGGPQKRRSRFGF